MTAQVEKIICEDDTAKSNSIYIMLSIFCQRFFKKYSKILHNLISRYGNINKEGKLAKLILNEFFTSKIVLPTNFQ